MKRIILLLIGLFCCSCFKDPYHLSEAYFKAQYRDPRIIGKWKVIEVNKNSVKDRIDIFYCFSKEGELKITQKGESDILFFYTKGSRLFRLQPREDFKRAPWVNEYEYKIVENKLILRRVFEGEVTESEEVYIKIE